MSRFTLYSTASAIALCCATPPAFADEKPSEQVEKVVVTASRIGAVPEDRLGTAVTVIDADQLNERQTRFVADVLRDVPGVEVSRSGGVGSLTQVRMRGGEANHTLVLLDGADMSDPFIGEFDFEQLVASDIARIEVLRGSQSALYGSDAIGGVINIIPRRGAGALSIEAMGEAGSFDTYQAGANLGFGDDTSDVFVSASHHATSGTNISHFGSEDDGERDTSVFVNAGLHVTPNLELRALGRYVDSHADLDPQDGSFPVTPTEGLVIDGPDTTASKQFYAKVAAELSALDGKWLTRLSYAYADVDRDNVSTNFFAFPVGLSPTSSNGTRHSVDFVSAFSFDIGTVSNKLTGAIDWKRESFSNQVPASFIDSEGDTDETGYVLSYDLSFDSFDAGAAFRHDSNDRFEDANTYRLQASYRLTDQTRLRATAGSGIKNPTSTELFGFDPSSFIGNPNLVPEKSVGWDIGIDQMFADGAVRFTATYFEATLKHEIFTDFSVFPFTANNLKTDSDRKGVELTLNAKLGETWTVDAAYTYLDATQNGLQEVRRAPNIASFNLTHRFFGNRASATLTARYNGEQVDSVFVPSLPSRVTLDAFTLVNLSASYDLTDNIQFFGRVENLFDTKYEEVFSYNEPGIAAYAGIKTKF